MSVLSDLFTGLDGKTHDVGRYMAIATCVTGLGLQIYAVGWKGQAFDFQAFGIGCGAMAAGIGAMLKLKAETEPKPSP